MIIEQPTTQFTTRRTSAIDRSPSIATRAMPASPQIACDAMVLVTARLPNDALYLDLKARQAEWRDAGTGNGKVIGDANAPAPIAWATYAGHRYAEELDAPDIGDAVPFRRELPALVAR